MAKIGLTKLGLSVNKDIKTFKWNDQIIEVKQYLPIQDKLNLCAQIINDSVDDNNYYNPGHVAVYQLVGVVIAYTNINVTEKQKEDIPKLFDLLNNGFAQEVYANMRPGELESITAIVEATIDNIYKYKNSVMGILEAVSADYSNLNLDAQNIRDNLTAGNGVEFLKDVMDKLG